MKRFRVIALVLILAGWFALFIWEAFPLKPTADFTVNTTDVYYYDNNDANANTILFLFASQMSELSRSLLRSFVHNGYSAYAAYNVNKGNIEQVVGMARDRQTRFGIIGVGMPAQALIDAVGDDDATNMLALVNPIILGNERVDALSPRISLLLCYNPYSEQYDEQAAEALYDQLYLQSENPQSSVKLILEEQVWHNYDEFVWRILTDCTEFAADTFGLPLTIERQELRTWYIFFVFFAIYLMCDLENIKSHHKKEHKPAETPSISTV